MMTTRSNLSGYFRKADNFYDTHTGYFLAAILLTALLLRVAALLSLKQSVYFNYLIGDEELYHYWAKSIADGTFRSSLVYEFAPLPAYLMAMVYKIFSADVIYFRYMNLLLNVFTCGIIYGIGKELAGKKVGLLAALIACLYKPFILYSIVPLKTSLAVFLFALVIYFFVANIDRPSIFKSIATGIFLGLLINVRPHVIVLIPCILFLLWWYFLKNSLPLKRAITLPALFFCGLLLALLPFMLRNYFVANTLSLTTSQTGFHLYLYNSVQYPDNGVPFASNSPSKRGIQFTIEASRRVNRKLSPNQASSYWTKQTFHEALQSPEATIKKLGEKFLVFFSWFETDSHYQIGFLSKYVPFFKLPLFNFWLIFPLGVAGMVLSRENRKAWFAMSLIFCLYSSTLILFYTYTRIRLPLFVILMPFASLTVIRMVESVRNRQVRYLGAALTVLSVILILELFPGKHTGDVTGQTNIYAAARDQAGLHPSKTYALLEESSKMNGRASASANLALARRHFAVWDIPKTIQYLEKIPLDSFAIAERYELYGDLMLKIGKQERAVRAYQGALRINFGLTEPRRKLIKIYEKRDLAKAREMKKELNYISSFYDLYGSTHR